MKILHLLYESKGDYFGMGGVGIRAYEIYRYLKERHDITLLCKKYPGAGDCDIEGLRHIFVGTESNSLTRTMLSYAYHSALFVMKYGKDFNIVIEEFSPATLRFLEYYSKKPVVLEIQLYIGNQYFRKYNIIKSSLLYVSEKYTPHCYKNIIVPSGVTKKRFGLEGRKNVQVIPNGISWHIPSPEKKEKDYILYLGRISLHHKGLDILLDAYREFHRVFPHIKLVVAGDGADRERF